MRKWIVLLLGIIFMTSCEQQPVSTTVIVERDYLTDLINKPSTDEVQVINFWATWCVPCIEELPAFTAVDQMDDIQVILISLDDASQIDRLVNPFLKENNITSTVKLLDDPYAAEWIPMVDPHWDGAIPATLIQRGDKKLFYNKSFTQSELEDELEKFL
jgi:thiol-disulfide isomerase/thioredoxin